MNRMVGVMGGELKPVAVSFAEPMSDDAIHAEADTRTIAEFRADKYPSTDPSYLSGQMARLAIMPVLLTNRCKEQDGGWTGTEAERFGLAEELMLGADCLDWELSAPNIDEAVDLAHGQDKIIVVSTHNFKTTPPTEEMEDQLERALEIGADFVKFACSAKTIEQYQLLAEFTLRHREDNVIVVAMDDYGPLSRIALPGLGSRLTYAFPGNKAVAPGQLSSKETRTLLDKFYPV